MPLTDLRDERFPPARVPSPNLAKVFAALETGELASLKTLAATIEVGNASGSEEESLTVYEALPLLMDYVIDLAHMCRRREEALAEQGVHVGAS